MQPVVQPTADLHSLSTHAGVPVWLPWPLPRGWLLTGLASARDGRTGVWATAMACSAPAPLGGVGELVLVGGAGGRSRRPLRRHRGTRPGSVPDLLAAVAKIHAARHPTAMGR